MDVDGRLGIVTVKETRAFSEMCIEAGFLLREVSLIQSHRFVWNDDGSDDLCKALVAFRKCLQVWADTAETAELNPVLPIAHLLKLGVDAVLADHRRKKGALRLEKLSKI